MVGKKKLKTAPKNIPQKQGWKTVLGVFGMLVWVGAAVIASQLVVGWLIVLILGPSAFDRPVVTAAYSALAYILAMCLVILVPPKVLAKWRSRRGEETRSDVKLVDRETLGLKGLPTWTDIGLAPVGFIVYLIVAAGLAAIFSQFSWFDASEAQDVGFSVYIAGLDKLVAFLTLVVVAPVAEEVIFRGWLYGKMRKRLNRVVPDKISMGVSIVLVSVLFGLVHMQWNVGVNVFAMSLVLCALREITGTVYAGILMHMIKNGVAFYLLYVIGMSA